MTFNLALILPTFSALDNNHNNNNNNNNNINDDNNNFNNNNNSNNNNNNNNNNNDNNSALHKSLGKLINILKIYISCLTQSAPCQ